MVLTDLIFFAVSTLRGCSGLDRTDLNQFPLWEDVVVFTDLIFLQFLLWEGVVVLKEWIFNSCLFGQVWWS